MAFQAGGVKHHETNMTKKKAHNENNKDLLKHLNEKNFSPNIFIYIEYIIFGIWPK